MREHDGPKGCENTRNEERSGIASKRGSELDARSLWVGYNHNPMRNLPIYALCLSVFAFCAAVAGSAQTIPTGAAIDAEVNKIMANTHANGMAVAVIDHGKVGYVHAYGIRNAKGDPLTTDTVMYGASLTKTVFAYTVMQLVDQLHHRVSED